jgi:hypothetical protein
VAAVLLLVGGGCTGDDAPSASAGPSTTTEDWVATDDDDALFTVDCTFSHRAADDPIVLPGEPGASHSHEFFGSATTDATSTGSSLQGTPTTCEDTEDTAAYWVPTLSIDGVPVDPTFVRAYYRAAAGTDVRDVRPPPLGLAMIAGDPNRRTAAAGDPPGEPDTTEHHHHGGAMTTVPGADPTAAAGWGCGLRPRRFHVEPPTDCTDPSPLTLRLRFPDCWDGDHLDSEDHRSHVAPSVDGTCPATHPVLLTQLQLSIVWPVTGAEAARATLSSGAVAGAHGDFLNGWDPDALAGHVDLCIRAKANCTIG